MINKCIVAVVLIASIATHSVVLAESTWVPEADADALSQYRQVADIFIASTSTIPQVVEVSLNTLPTGAVIVVPQQNPQFREVPQIVETSNRRIDVSLTVTDSAGVVEPALFDQDPRTTVSFPVREMRGQTTVLLIETAAPVAATGLEFILAPGVVAPQRLTIVGLDTIDGEQIIYQGAFPQRASNVTFPQTVAQTWQVVISHTQPLVLSELRLSQVGSLIEQERTLRFLAQPNEAYSLYYDSPITGTMSRGTRNLLTADTVVPGVLLRARAHTGFIEPDTDIDGIPNGVDNCPTVINTDQRDDNQNGQGDACEDFDFDGHLNYRDNCPLENNPDQRDTDSDGVGDVCDDMESRLLEQYPWIAWLGLIAASLTIGLLFWFVRRMPVPTEPESSQS